MRGAGFRSPGSAAPWHARPRDRKSRLEFLRILRMNAGAVLEGQALNLRRRPLAHRRAKIEVVTNDDALGGREAVRRVDNLPDFLIGPRSAAVNLVVLFPESSLELQTDFAGAVVPRGGDGGLHRLR